jgi:isocitrate dehydrogenase (NAD+)
MSGVLLLRHLGLDEHANAINDSVLKVLRDGKIRTPDQGGSSTTTDFTLAVIANL